jgi:hypothetical protein
MDVRALLLDIQREIAAHPVELAARRRIPSKVHLDLDILGCGGAGLDVDRAEFGAQC